MGRKTEGTSALEKEIIVINPVKKAENIKLRTAAYCRVSSDSEDQINSFSAQLEHYSKLFQESKNLEAVDIYADEGITGLSTEKREEFQRLIKDCRAGKIDKIYTKSISRFSRNTKDCLETVRELKRLGISIYFEKENIDTSSMTNEMILSMYSAGAQEESISVSNNMKIGCKMRMKNGTYIQPKAPIGYKIENKQLTLDEQEKETVKRIFSQYLLGTGMQKIANELNKDNIRTKVADCIEKKTIVNNGELPKYLIKNAHKGIISREMSDMAQEELSKRNSKKKVSEISSKTEHSKYSGKYALTGMIVCGNCGSVYRRQNWTNRDKTKKAVWRCLKRLEYGTKYCDCSPTLEEQKIKDAVMEAINRVFKDNAGLTDILSKNLMETLTEKKEDENPYVLKKRLKELEDTMMSLVAFSAKAGESEKFYIRFKKISDEMIHIRDRIAKSEITGKDKRLEKKVESAVEKFRESKEMLNEYDDRVVRMIVDEIMVVGEDKLMVFIKGGEEVEVKIK